MPPTIDGIIAKIHRADESIRNLDAEITRFLAENYRIGSEFDVESRQYRFRAFGDSQLPPRFAVLTGEIIQHLRSVLDHLVTQLAAVGPGGGNPELLEFPICLTPEKFGKACRRGKIGGVSDDASAIIDSWQPYRTSDPPEHSTLWVLHDLNRIDKHRLLLMVAACVEMADQIEINSSKDVVIVEISPPPPVGVRPSADGTQVFAFHFGEKFDPEVKMKANFRFQMAFGQPGIVENLEVIPLLNTMRDMVATVANSFGKFLKQ